MKFDCGETWEEKERRLSQWHPFFALLPRSVGPHDCRWLEWVERRGRYYANMAGEGWHWKYRAMED